jgi:oxalate decarboxylase
MARTNVTQARESTSGVPNRPTPTFGNPDLPPEGRVNTAGNPESLRSDGPRNMVIEGQFPSQMDPPATDISTQASSGPRSISRPSGSRTEAGRAS